MKNIKDITISIFAIIGFIAIISGFTNQAEQTNQTTPESHVWEMHLEPKTMFDKRDDQASALSINKQTGEVRKYRMNPMTEGNRTYIVMKEQE